jgi:non-ribosomal peptide synthetase component E (peptide arylation enzyme)
MDSPVITNEIHPVVDAIQAVVSTATKSQGIDCDLRSSHELLTTHVHTQPERTAVATSDLRTVISYRQLDTLVRSAAAQLSSMEISKGDTVVALISDNCVEFVVRFSLCLRTEFLLPMDASFCWCSTRVLFRRRHVSAFEVTCAHAPRFSRKEHAAGFPC